MSQAAAKRRKTDAGATDGATISDSRFTNIQSDPRYKLPGKRQRVKVDKRFARALEDDDFSRKAKVDRYGRPIETDSEKKRLKRKYEIEDDEEQSDSESTQTDDEQVSARPQQAAEARDVLREGKAVSSSDDESSSEEESDDEDVEALDEAGPGVQEQDVPMGEVSSRIAVVNLDWDNIRAEDLMAVFQSFLPATGRLLRVSIYPSEFGKERMEREEMEGPPKEIFARQNQDEDEDSESDVEEDDEDIKDSIIKPDDGTEFDSAALRHYQLDRLRYYYAVLTFSDQQTAKSIYDAVDGTEYLSTANFFDLRFIPDETDFSEDTPREECDRISTTYKPNEFVTDALQHSKVKLTWDADDTTRKEVQARAFRAGRKDIDENDLKAYLGSDSESDEDEIEMEDTTTDPLSKKEAERQRMRALLGLAPEPEKKSSRDKKKNPVGNIQITFSSGLAGAALNSDDDTSNKTKKKRSVFENSPEPEETTMEKYIRKEKERKQRRKEKMKAPRDGSPSATSVQQPEVTEDIEANSEEEQGFNDPFFAEPDNDTKTTHKQRKADRLQHRAEREAEEAASAKSRAKLEKLMADDDHDAANPSSTKPGRTVKHFDMTEIEKAEKAMLKKEKQKSKHKAKPRKDGMAVDHEAVLAADNFEIDTTDPRFTSVFENHEFAIDPTNPRFKGTKGMKAILEEGRKRKNDNRTSAAAATGGDTEVMGLVEKIKRKNG